MQEAWHEPTLVGPMSNSNQFFAEHWPVSMHSYGVRLVQPGPGCHLHSGSPRCLSPRRRTCSTRLGALGFIFRGAVSVNAGSGSMGAPTGNSCSSQRHWSQLHLYSGELHMVVQNSSYMDARREKHSPRGLAGSHDGRSA